MTRILEEKDNETEELLTGSKGFPKLIKKTRIPIGATTKNRYIPLKMIIKLLKNQRKRKS